MSFSSAQRLLGYILKAGQEEFLLLRNRFDKAEEIPSLDAVTRSCYKSLYESGWCTYDIFNLRTSSSYKDFLDPLMEEAVDAETAKSIIEELSREKYKQLLLAELTEATSNLVSGLKSPQEVLSKIRDVDVPTSKKTLGWGDYVSYVEEEMKVAAERGEELKSGIQVLDNLYSWRRKNVTILAAPTSHGKTALAIRMLARAARAGLEVSYNTFEDWTILPHKFASHNYQVPLWYFTKYHLVGDAARSQVDEALMLCKQYDNISVFPELTLGEWEHELRRKPPDLLILDYAQRYAECHGTGDKRGDVGSLAAHFESLCKKYNAYGILISQIRRRETTEGGAIRKPCLYDLKESGDLENYATGVIMLYWPWKDARDKNRLDKNDYLIMIEKDKTGECGEVHCLFDGETQTHRDYSGVSLVEGNRLGSGDVKS